MKKGVINCHAHIFTGRNVPPYLAKTFVPFPLYKILTVPLIIKIFRFWFLNPRSPYKWVQQGWNKKLQKTLYYYQAFRKRNPAAGWFIGLINGLLIYHAIIYLFYGLNSFFIHPNQGFSHFVQGIVQWLKGRHLIYFPPGGAWRSLIVLFVLFFVHNGRRILFFLLKSMWNFLRVLPDKKTLQFLARYVNIGRYAYYLRSNDIFTRLRSQYEPGTGFVILPMDMTYMEAGTLKADGCYERQMEALAAIKNGAFGDFMFPFVFADPRRDSAAGKPNWSWEPGKDGSGAENGSVVPGDCFIRDCFSAGFRGIKIYPALGYYPFDARLLALWKYAADNGIPIITHCIRGTIFYRGAKKKEWDTHPYFKQAQGNNELKKLLLPQLKNVEFINNFTHPLNYLCLLHERLLRLVVADSDDKTKRLFGYTDSNTPLKHNLEKLKMCFGHYGGEEEWQLFFQRDRDNFTSQVITNTHEGICFVDPGDTLDETMTRLELIWKQVDWYSIISSMILKYDHVYADISYIVHDDSIVPLLAQTLEREGLREKVLYGTDFYVVRNHKSDKEMLADTESALTGEAFDRIARDNPREFLHTSLHGPVTI